MPLALRSIRLAAQLLALCLVVACSVPAAAAAAVLPPKGEGPLSPPLLELARPAVASEPAAVQADRLGVPRSGPGSLVRDRGRVLVTARLAALTPAALDGLRGAGAEVVSSSRDARTATLAVAPAQLRALAAVPGVRSVWQIRKPIVRAVEGSCEGGSALSEGLEQLRVDEAREAFELRGKGITIGVLSDSFDTAKDGGESLSTTAQDDEASNDLPGPAGSCSGQQLPVDVLDEGPDGEGDEGRAMLQIVHDLAPHASLAFATAFESEESFAQNIERLAEPVSEGGAGAEVIVDDVAWFEEPFFQDGPVAAAIDKVTAAGVSYFAAAGNDNLFDEDGDEISSWEAPEFRDSGTCPAAVLALPPEFNGAHCMDFDPGAEADTTFGVAVEAGETLTIDLQWAEPWNGVVTDLDAYLLSNAGTIVAASTEDNASLTGTQRPVEILQWENTAATTRVVRLAINRFSGADPRLKFIFLQNGGGVSATEYPESSGGDVVGPAIYGHAGAAGAISVAAVPFTNGDAIEPYSSRGPVTHYFGPVSGPLPALPLLPPEEIAKPDLAATDCGANTFFGFLSGGAWRFCGTSAAAPHAAAVAALVRQAKPSLGQEEVREALTETAEPVGAFPPEAAGAGLVDAFKAIAGLPAPIEGGDGPSEPAPPVEEPPNEEPPVIAPFEAPPAVNPAPQPPRPTPAAPPSTTILRGPPKLVRTRARAVRLAFRFASNQGSVGFLCKVDRSPYRLCPRRFARFYPPGRHVLRVRARGADGLLDPTPATHRFRVVLAG